MAAHHEIHLETYIVNKLVENGWVEGLASHYDPVRALYPDDVLSWIKISQPQTWEKLSRLNGGDADKAVLERLDKALSAKTGGTMKVLRQGFELAGAGHIAMSQPAAEDQRNLKAVELYRANILRVVRQLKYCPTREWAIDLVFFINGIPVATVELKTDFTQAIEDAIWQYKRDRLPQDPQSWSSPSKLLSNFWTGQVNNPGQFSTGVNKTRHLIEILYRIFTDHNLEFADFTAGVNALTSRAMVA